MSEMLIMMYEYSTLWHVDEDLGEELLGEFQDVEVDEEEQAEDPEYEEEEVVDVAFLNNGAKYLHYLVV